MQMIEEALQGICAVETIRLLVGGNLIDGLSEGVGEVQRLQQRVQIAGCALVLEADHTSLLLRIVVDKVVPEDTGRVLQNAHISSDVGGVSLNHGPVALIPCGRKEAPELCEACKSPIAFFSGKSVSSRMRYPHGRVLGVPKHQHELHAGTPVFWYFVFLIALLQVEGRILDVVAEGEEKDAPGMASALKYRALLATTETAPFPDLPGTVGLGLCLQVLQVGHVLLHKGVILVGAGPKFNVGVGFGFVHGFVDVWVDDSYIILLVHIDIVGIDEHVATELQERDVSTEKVGLRVEEAGNVKLTWSMLAVAASARSEDVYQSNVGLSLERRVGS